MEARSVTQARLRDQLAAWLASNRSHRCTLIVEPHHAVLTVGETGTVIVRLAPGDRNELKYVRSSPQPPSPVSDFEVRVVDRAHRSLLWSGTVSRAMDDVAGSPRVRLAWGPITTAGEHEITVRLGNRDIEGSPVTVRVRPCAASARTAHGRLALCASLAGLCPSV